MCCEMIPSPLLFRIGLVSPSQPQYSQWVTRIRSFNRYESSGGPLLLAISLGQAKAKSHPPLPCLSGRPVTGSRGEQVPNPLPRAIHWTATIPKGRTGRSEAAPECTASNERTSQCRRYLQ